jgi:hypothetical protein
MCGFIGSFNQKTKQSKLLLDNLRHRGPDASGYWSSQDGQCSFAHVRLSIVELTEAGSQPMLSASRRTAIVFNGEIYNHLELRRRVTTVHWRGHSDTETLLELWERHGTQCIPWLRGMFAFAVYDNQENILHLVRDRFGIKPLYFQRASAGETTFASEVRALLGGQKIALNKHAMAFYLATGHIQNEGEIGEGVEILSPGSFARVDRNGGISKKRKGYKIIDYSVPSNNRTVVYSDNLKNGNGQYINTKVIKYLNKDGISSIISGHRPHGDCPLVLRSKNLTAVSADISYSDKGHISKWGIDNRGSAVCEVLLYINGDIQIHGILSDKSKYNYIIKNKGSKDTSNSSKYDKYIGIQLKNNYWVKNVKKSKYLISYAKGFELDEKWISIKELQSLL